MSVLASTTRGFPSDDAGTGVELVDAVPGDVRWVIGGAAYDATDLYAAATRRGARTIIPPTKNATVKRRRAPERNQTLLWIDAVGWQRWRLTSGYTHQARAENTFFRYKQIIGDRLRSRSFAAQVVETTMACNVLNRMTMFGRPESVAVGR